MGDGEGKCLVYGVCLQDCHFDLCFDVGVGETFGCGSQSHEPYEGVGEGMHSCDVRGCDPSANDIRGLTESTAVG